MGNASAVRSLKAVDFTDDKFGVPTVTDILKELEKPGRDPRVQNRDLAEGVETLNDLQVGMITGRVGHQRHQLRCLRGYRRQDWCTSLAGGQVR